ESAVLQGEHLHAVRRRARHAAVADQGALTSAARAARAAGSPRSSIARAIPPRTATDAAASLSVGVSARNTTPPAAAMTGTASCTVEADIAVSRRSARYHNT